VVGLTQDMFHAFHACQVFPVISMKFMKGCHNSHAVILNLSPSMLELWIISLHTFIMNWVANADNWCLIKLIDQHGKAGLPSLAVV